MKLYDINNYENIDDSNVKICLDFLAKNGGSKIALGRHEVNANGIYVGISEYNTRLQEEGKWEAHKKYQDLQIVLSGKEYIYVSDIQTMTEGTYVVEKDFLSCDGKAEKTIFMKEGLALLLMPEDVHMPNMSVDETSSKVKKAVFKIPMNNVCE